MPFHTFAEVIVEIKQELQKSREYLEKYCENVLHLPRFRFKRVHLIFFVKILNDFSVAKNH